MFSNGSTYCLDTPEEQRKLHIARPRSPVLTASRRMLADTRPVEAAVDIVLPVNLSVLDDAGQRASLIADSEPESAPWRSCLARWGHDGMRAALMYQHNPQGADRKIADALEAVIGGYGLTADLKDDRSGHVARGLHGRDASNRLAAGPDEESCS